MTDKEEIQKLVERTDEVIGDSIFAKKPQKELIHIMTGLLSEYMQLASYFIDKQDNAKQRYEAQAQSLEDCSRMTTEKALIIKKLEAILEETVKMPKGVEPHSLSDYKAKQDNTDFKKLEEV